jgi:hypothetical protein
MSRVTLRPAAVVRMAHTHVSGATKHTVAAPAVTGISMRAAVARRSGQKRDVSGSDCFDAMKRKPFLHRYCRNELVFGKM